MCVQNRESDPDGDVSPSPARPALARLSRCVLYSLFTPEVIHQHICVTGQALLSLVRLKVDGSVNRRWFLSKVSV